MSEAVVTALISGILTVMGVIFTNRRQSREIEFRLEKAQAVTDTRLEELAREVREHNNFARRVPVAEEKIRALEGRVRDMERK